MSKGVLMDLNYVCTMLLELRQDHLKLHERVGNLTEEVVHMRRLLGIKDTEAIRTNISQLEALSDAELKATHVGVDTTYASWFGETFHDKVTLIIDNTSDVSITEQLYAHLRGPTSLFTKYLSKLIIDNGKGDIAPIKMHSEDIFTVSAMSLIPWPDGFYLNCTTKDIQFLISSPLPSYLFCLDGLPGNVGKFMIYEFNKGGDIGTYLIDKFVLTDETIAIDKLMLFCKELDEALSLCQIHV